MSEYIDRTAAIDALHNVCERVCWYSPGQRPFMCNSCEMGNAIEALESIPVTEIQDGKTGIWIYHSEQKNIYGGKLIECSKCGTQYLVQNIPDEKFCRNCGVKMCGTQIRGQTNEK